VQPYDDLVNWLRQPAPRHHVPPGSALPWSPGRRSEDHELRARIGWLLRGLSGEAPLRATWLAVKGAYQAIVQRAEELGLIDPEPFPYGIGDPYPALVWADGEIEVLPFCYLCFRDFVERNVIYRLPLFTRGGQSVDIGDVPMIIGRSTRLPGGGWALPPGPAGVEVSSDSAVVALLACFDAMSQRNEPGDLEGDLTEKLTRIRMRDERGAAPEYFTDNEFGIMRRVVELAVQAVASLPYVSPYEPMDFPRVGDVGRAIYGWNDAVQTMFPVRGAHAQDRPRRSGAYITGSRFMPNSTRVLDQLREMTSLWETGGDIGRPDGFFLRSTQCWILHVDAWIWECLGDCPVESDEEAYAEAVRRAHELARDWKREFGDDHAGVWEYSPATSPYAVTWALDPVSCEMASEYAEEDILVVAGGSGSTDGPRGMRPRRQIQEEKIRRLVEELGTGPEIAYVERMGELVESPEGPLPPPDPIFGTEIWVNVRARNPLRDREPHLVPIASMGAYTRRQADRFVRFLDEFYAIELAPDDPLDELPYFEMRIESDWAFEPSPQLNPAAVAHSLRVLQQKTEQLIRAFVKDDPESIVDVLARDPDWRRAQLLRDQLTQWGVTDLEISDQFAPVPMLSLVNTEPGLDATFLGVQRRPWIIAEEITRQYGGGEEGGWWYNHHEPVAVLLTRRDTSADVLETMFRTTYEDLIDQGDIYSVLGGAEFRVYRSLTPPMRPSREAPPFE